MPLPTAIYLRRSRAEEGLNIEETLSRHRAALLAYADVHGIVVAEPDIYREVVTGESLYCRPEMLRLLEAVSEGRYSAVLCMDLDRLGRGGMADQGIILDAFKFSETLILTPDRRYNLADDIDEEAAEFGTFLSRREYKMITKRLRRGLHQTIEAGGYVANTPFGYDRDTVNKLPTLKINPDEAPFVRMIFELYRDGNGCTSICETLNALGVHGRRDSKFNRNTIRTILENPVYIGKIRWNRTRHIKTGSGKERQSKVVWNRAEDWMVCDGVHPAILSQELWDAVRTRRALRTVPRYNVGQTASALAGLGHCAQCGRRMQMCGNSGGVNYWNCPTRGCSAGAQHDFVEAAVLDQLRQLLHELEVQLQARAVPHVDVLNRALAAVEVEAKKIAARKERLHDLLEDGTYDRATYLIRMKKAESDEAALLAQRESLTAEHRRQTGDGLRLQAAQLRNALEVYDHESIAGRNALLKSVVSDIRYDKPKKTKPADFSIELTLRTFD